MRNTHWTDLAAWALVTLNLTGDISARLPLTFDPTRLAHAVAHLQDEKLSLDHNLAALEQYFATISHPQPCHG